MRVGGVEGAKMKNPLNTRIKGVLSFTLLLLPCKRLPMYICISLGNRHITVACKKYSSSIGTLKLHYQYGSRLYHIFFVPVFN